MPDYFGFTDLLAPADFGTLVFVLERSRRNLKLAVV
jgi:hypothetical protein